MKQYYVYIMASKRNGTLYIGVTSNLIKHKNDVVKGFTQKYKIHYLVYYEVHLEINQAITREKQLKAWHRKWKIELIEKNNPNWKDLYESLI